MGDYKPAQTYLERAALTQGDVAAAQANIERVLSYLAPRPTFDGAANCMRAFRFAWEILHGLGRTEATAILQTAAQLIEGQLEKLPDTGQRELYLRQTHHWLLWQAWQASEG